MGSYTGTAAMRVGKCVDPSASEPHLQHSASASVVMGDLFLFLAMDSYSWDPQFYSWGTQFYSWATHFYSWALRNRFQLWHFYSGSIPGPRISIPGFHISIPGAHISIPGAHISIPERSGPIPIPGHGFLFLEATFLFLRPAFLFLGRQE